MANKAISWRQTIRNEFFELSKWRWYISSTPLLIVALPCISFICYLSLLCFFCLHNTLAQTELPYIDIPAADIIANQTVSLFDDISNTDISASHRFVIIQTSLGELQARIQNSSVSETAKQKVKTHFEKLDLLIVNSINGIISMQIAFESAQENIKICTEHALDGLSSISNNKKPRTESEPQDASEIEAKQLKILFNGYISSVSVEVEQILSNAVTTQSALDELMKRLHTLASLYKAGQQSTRENIDESKSRSIWARNFGGNKTHLEPQQRAIKNVEDFIDFHQFLINNVSSVILKVQEYKNEINQLSQTKVPFDPVNINLEHYTEQLQNALTRLLKSKEAFDEKMTRNTQQQKTEL